MTSPPAPPAGRSRDLDWDAEWEVAWKAHPENAWFRHQAAVLGRAVAPSADGRPTRVLKTDAFEEACGFPTPLDALDAPGVLIDVSSRILAKAAQRGPAAFAYAAMDLRQLGLRPASFDLIVSHSTLDHFARESDIAVALRELHGVLRPGGRLVVTLDNPWNPVLLLRRAIHRIRGPMGDLIPFPMGRTLSRARLVRVLEREGFRVSGSGYLLHTPRVVGLWAGEWAARRARGSAGRWLVAAFACTERLVGRLPTRGLTGHFVVADCRRPDVLTTT